MEMQGKEFWSVEFCEDAEVKKCDPKETYRSRSSETRLGDVVNRQMASRQQLKLKTILLQHIRWVPSRN